MGLLRTALLVYLASACYSPDVRDCTVTCHQAADCAPGQICGADGFCAAEDVAGRCDAKAVDVDAGIDGPQPPADAMPDAPPDAWPTVKLWVRIDGRGTVAIPDVGSCESGSGQTECPFDVKQGVQLTLHATPKMNWRFDRWFEGCAGQPTSTCTIAPSGNTAVRVRFEIVDDDLL